ncbi:MAG: GntR family transcriptional regulator [Deltaproteobacteria bacterium]|nr:GntR family transcriptional regulator [Deltaproteobacteria bacterium]
MFEFPKIHQPKMVILQVSEALRELITSGRLKPGEKLKEIEMANSLGVSRSPVREALRILELEGLVEITPRRGAYVHLITMEDVKDIYQTREMIEGFAGFLAVENMTNEDIADIEKLWELMKGLSSNENLESYLAASSDFHNKIITCARNKKIEEIYQGIRNWVKFLRSYVLSYSGRMTSSLEEHERIVEAIKKKDKYLVEQASREHVRKGRENLMSLIQQQSKSLSENPIGVRFN